MRLGRRPGRRALVVVVAMSVAALPGCGRASEPQAQPTDPFEEHDEIRFSDLEAFAGVPFADDLKAEQDRFARGLIETPDGGLAAPDFSGRFTNVEDGVRHTLRPTCDCERRTLWLVGGSTAFGLGQRDDYTIASELVRLGERDGLGLEVLNIAVPGWTIWEEYQAVASRLADRDGVRPDLIVSFGGFNDAITVLISAMLGRLNETAPVLMKKDEINEVYRRRLGVAAAGDIRAVAATAARRFDETRRLLAGAASTHGIPTAFFLQPDALADPVQWAAVDSVVRGMDPALGPDVNEYFGFFDAALDEETVGLRSLYDGLGSPVFADWAHTNERGAAVAAAAVYERIGPMLGGR